MGTHLFRVRANEHLKNNGGCSSHVLKMRYKAPRAYVKAHIDVVGLGACSLVEITNSAVVGFVIRLVWRMWCEYRSISKKVAWKIE